MSDGWVLLDWKEPVDGGAVAACKIQRRLRPDGLWSDVGLAGEGEPSNIVMAVL